ncbi:MAG: hypothetical protein HYT09_04230 [Candidatus Levybacteria bacterium]|nr:hypothetical protein [Candidatus Levybacteria bacterium]
MENPTQIKKWSWWMILLWAYSTIWLGFILLLGFLDLNYVNEPISQSDAIIGLLSFVPILIFLILEGRDHLRR